MSESKIKTINGYPLWVETDPTLTGDGAPADAKAVGEAISALHTVTEPVEGDIPKVYIDGAKPVAKEDVFAEMRYISKSDKFHAYLKIKCQGNASMAYAKKNFTVKLYSDKNRETKLKRDFRDWNHPSNKFVLKANWVDHSHARNIVSARLWGEVVASRPDYESLPVEMRNSPNNGAVDGFPIKVYYNGVYQGIYTWNIGKDDWMWGMDEDNPNHILMCAEGNTDGVYAETASNFRALWDGVDGSSPGWSVEVGTNSEAVKNSLNRLIQFVIDNDGDDFRHGIGNYLDVGSAIDYYLFQYVICGLDGLAKNMLLATYDGMVWHCGAYDLDATYGNWWNGSRFVSAKYRCPEDYQEQFSLLWERINALYADKIKERYADLRASVLSLSNMYTHFERFCDIIGNDLYAEDLIPYPAIPSADENNITQIRNFIRERLAYVDSKMEDRDVALTWSDGYGYDDATGELTANANLHYTEKVKLKNGQYKYSVTGKWPSIFVWDEYGNYLHTQSTPGTVKEIVFFANPDYTYAFRVYQTADFDAQAQGLTLVDTAETAVERMEFDLSAAEWTTSTASVSGGVEMLLTGLVDGNQIRNCGGRFAVFMNISQNNMAPEWYLFNYKNQIYLRTFGFGADPAAAAAYFAENGEIFVING